MRVFFVSYVFSVSFLMKLDMLGDMLGKIHVARKYKRLSSAVVCYHHLIVILSVAVGTISSTYLMCSFSELRGFKIPD